jgi:hypothetical protein
MQRSLQNLLAVFILLGAIAWWITGRVSVSGSVHEFFLGVEESSTQSEASSKEQEKALVDKVFAELPPLPEEHSPEVGALISRLKEIQTTPAILVKAVQRDQDTPKDQIPNPWSEAELEALKNYQTKFRETWEPFLSGPQPNWEKFPDSAIFFRSHFPPVGSKYEDTLRYAFYEARKSENWSNDPLNHPEFYARLFRQCTTLGTLRFGIMSTWTTTDTVSLTKFSEEEIRKSEYFFSPQSQNPEELLSLAPSPPTVATLREGLKTDRAVFMKTAQYLESLPPQTPAKIALTRLMGDESDANWFVSHVESPKTVRDLAVILRQAAEQINSLEQKTYLSGPAWRQWLTGDLNSGLNPALKDTLRGMMDFEKTAMQYQVSLAFLQASATYRKSGVEGMRNIPDPARPGSFLAVISSTNGITISSAYQKDAGKNMSFSFKPEPAP